MRKARLLSAAVFVLAVFYAAGTSYAGGTTGDKVDVKLNAVPKVNTQAKADAKFGLDKDGDELYYTLNVDRIKNVTMAHIHAVADDGSPGAILAWIYPTTGDSPSLKAGNFTGTLAEGDLTAAKLVGPMKGKTPKDLLRMLESGKAGVAIHTKEHSGGELWGVAKHKTAGVMHKTATGGYGEEVVPHS